MHAAQAQTADAPASNIPARIDIPIREVLLENGARLYSIPIKLGNTEIEAGMDTGSTAFDVLYEAGGRDRDQGAALHRRRAGRTAGATAIASVTPSSSPPWLS
jgi:hypothetical protein